MNRIFDQDNRRLTNGHGYLCAPGMGSVYRVKVPNDEGSSSRSLDMCPSSKGTFFFASAHQ